MAQGLNQVSLIGNLGADPETVFTPNGNQITKFRVAVNETWKGNDGNQHEHVEWFRIVCFNGRGQACADYLNKGRRVFVQGPQRTRTYTDREGEERRATEVIAFSVIFLDSPKQHERAEEAAPVEPSAGNHSDPGITDDVPF